ncbi:uncharacterized protein [Physcomitrium patens]|uniref:Uncharacterized protein n=1 Tax=Physcomitrium patens TaxID=3218 RepID=A0A7I4F0X0_PHYPA
MSKMDKDALRVVFSDASRVGWSLRSDMKLHEWLEGFAERLKERTKEVAAEVHRLGTETGKVELHLQNNLNKLRALSATQFIENRVDEVDEVFVKEVEQLPKQSYVAGYDSQIIPRYKEAVLTAWEAFEGFKTNKSGLQTSDVKSRGRSQVLGIFLATTFSEIVQIGASMKLPHIIGTDEFMRDSHCGLAANFKTPEVYTRAARSDAESGSDTDRDEANLAEEMVGGRPWLEGEWSMSESETSGHQGGVLEPAVSAALDFKAMLEAALRGPSFPYDGGVIPNLGNAHEQHNHMDITLVPQEIDDDSPRTRSETGEVKLDVGLSTKNEQISVEDNMQPLGQLLTSPAPVVVNKTVLLRPPLQVPPAFNRNDNAQVIGSMGPRSSSSSTPDSHVPQDGYSGKLVPSNGAISRTDATSIPKGSSSTPKIQDSTGSSVPITLRTEENKPQAAPPASRVWSQTSTDDLPTPTLPDGLFQGLQVAIQARQLRSQAAQRDEALTLKEVTQRPEVSGEDKVSNSSKSSSGDRLSPLKLKPTNNKGFVNKSKGETNSKLQESKGQRLQGPISFQGGLFDDDDDDDDGVGKSTNDMPKGVTEISKNEAAKSAENPNSPFRGSKLSPSRSMVRQDLFDDFNDISIGSPSDSESAGNSALVGNTTEQPLSSLPAWRNTKRSSALQKSLFGDSDDENSE